MSSRILRAAIAVLFLAIAVAPLPVSARAALSVYVVAPSPSTAAEADVIVNGGGWRRVDRGEAANVLVVVRSGLAFPLMPNYDTLDALEEAAGQQPNASGPRFHVYVFGSASVAALKQLKHLSYDVPASPTKE
jgi:hypothetical protein